MRTLTPFGRFAAERTEMQLTSREKLWEDRKALRVRVAELEQGLVEYGEHSTPCPRTPISDGWRLGADCTCGLSLLKGMT